MHQRKFSREFKLEAVRFVRKHGVAVVQDARYLDVHENVLRKWVAGYPPFLAPALRKWPRYSAGCIPDRISF